MAFITGQVLTAAELNAVTLGDAATYTPVVGGAGTATWSARAGWYSKIGKLVFWNAYLVASGAGSGTATVTITSPSAPNRTTRQTVPVDGSGINSGSPANRSGWVRALTSGAGAVWDNIMLVNDAAAGEALLIGNQITTSTAITVQGWYLEL